METFNTELELRKQLKTLLYILAREKEEPGKELQRVIQEVIDELYHDVATATSKRRDLRLVGLSH